VVGGAPVALLLGSGSGFWVSVLLGVLVALAAAAITAVELLAGYRGWPQTTSLIIACLYVAFILLVYAWIAAGGAGT